MVTVWNQSIPITASPSGNGLHVLFCADNFQYDTKSYYIMNHKIHLGVCVSGATIWLMPAVLIQ